ncbi:MAG: HD domain-containing protein [Deltaproteobacteria bacterium]
MDSKIKIPEIIAKAESPVVLLAEKDVSPLLKLFFSLANGKQVYHKGWLEDGRNVPKEKCETIGDHTYGAVVYGLIIAKMYRPELNLLRVLELIIVHDLAESLVGDITKADGISSEQKYELEKAAMIYLFGSFPAGDYFIALWEEFEEKKTPEAKFANDMDKADMGIEGGIKLLQGYGSGILEIFNHAVHHVKDETAAELLQEITTLIKE